MSVIDNFMTMLMEKEEEGFLNPILTYGAVNFLYTKYSNIYIVATTKKNSNAVLVFQFLHKMVQVNTVISIIKVWTSDDIVESYN